MVEIQFEVHCEYQNSQLLPLCGEHCKRFGSLEKAAEYAKSIAGTKVARSLWDEFAGFTYYGTPRVEETHWVPTPQGGRECTFWHLHELVPAS